MDTKTYTDGPGQYAGAHGYASCKPVLTYYHNDPNRVDHSHVYTVSIGTLVALQTKLQNLQHKITPDKVCSMYKVMNKLVDTDPNAGSHELGNNYSW